MEDLLEVDLTQTAKDIWAAMLGLALARRDVPRKHHPDERVVTGVLQITGDWQGALTLQLTERLAAGAAATLFGIAPDRVENEEIVDTVGELTNVIGGNVKARLPGDLRVSLPAVMSGRDYQVAIAGTEVREHSRLDCDGELVVVSLFERRAT